METAWEQKIFSFPSAVANICSQEGKRNVFLRESWAGEELKEVEKMIIKFIKRILYLKGRVRG